MLLCSTQTEDPSDSSSLRRHEQHVEGLVHHRDVEGLRPHLGRGRARARRPRRRDRPRRRHARRRSSSATATRVLRVPLDVTDKAAVDAAVAPAHEHFGRLDVVVNNAGYGLFGTIEEISEEQARAQIETNLFGALWVTQAGAADPARAGLGPHHPGVLDRRRQRVPGPRPLPRLQVGPRGLQPVARRRAGARSAIKVTLVEPAGYSTDWARPVLGPAPSRCPPTTTCASARAPSCSGGAPSRGDPRGHRPGDPRARRRRRAAAAGRSSAPGTLEMIRAEYARRLRQLGALGRPRQPRARAGRGVSHGWALWDVSERLLAQRGT